MSDAKQVAAVAEEYLRENLQQVIALYRERETYGGTLAVSSDAALEYVSGYATPAVRTANRPCFKQAGYSNLERGDC